MLVIIIKIPYNNRKETEEYKAKISMLMRKINSESDGKLQNKGKGINEVESRQKRRKILRLKESCKSALWFSDSFNLDLLSIYFQVKNMDETSTLQYNQPTKNNLSDNHLFAIYQVLYLLDHFAVSDELYHEISMLFPSLPRSHIVRHIRKQLSENVEILGLPHPFLELTGHF